MARKRRPALNIVEDIGALGFDLQYHDAVEIAAAVRLLRKVNPELFDWLVKALSPDAVRLSMDSPIVSPRDSKGL